jgi:uncharacterized ferredoxin-like protein
MKKLFLAVVALGLLVSAQSCKKCGYCGSSSSTEFCEKDNKTLYDLAKSTCESNGGTWTVK